MTEREFFGKYYYLSENEQNKKDNKNSMSEMML